MKTILFTLLIAASISASAGKVDSIPVTSNGVTHLIRLNDVVHIGYGKNPYGSFQYIVIGAPAEGMRKDYAGKTGTVVRLIYWKMNDIYEIWVKIKGAGTYVVKIPQAVDVGEVTGFNDTYFNKQ